MTLKTIIDTFKDSLSSCPNCKSTLLTIEESINRYSVFDVESGKISNNKESTPVARYMFSCAVCRTKIFGHTTQIKEWETYWDFLANIFSGQESIKQKAKQRHFLTI
jgi:hypothetical protein